MTEDDLAFVDAFESCTLAEERFRHPDHVRLVWIYLQAGSVLECLERFPAGLRRYAASLGKSGVYHETITWAFVLLIHERMRRSPGGERFEEFASRNSDLFAWRPSILDAYYRSETLASDLARRVFVLPDAPAPAGSLACASTPSPPR